jgi:hypothetical protein
MKKKNLNYKNLNYKNLNYKNLKSYYFICLFVLIIIIYLMLYIIFIYPLYNLSIIHSKDEIVKLTQQLFLGVNDSKHFKDVRNYEINDITFYYLYYFFQSKTYTIWCLFNRHNKFSKNGTLLLYYYNHHTKHTELDTLHIDLKHYKTYTENGILHIQYLNNYKQEIDFTKNTMKVYISTNKNTLDMLLYIDDYNTTMPSLLNRYRSINKLISVDLIETHSPNEWASDNPLLGKIINGKFNNTIIEPNSNFWFDNFIGFDNFFVSEYYWFIIFNDNWLIYILYYGPYEKMNSGEVPIVLYIKNCKNNKIYNCSPGVSVGAFGYIDKAIRPLNINYKSNINKKIGDKIFDEYEIKFVSNEVSINIKSIPTKSVRVLLYDYYNDDIMENQTNLDEWNTRYKKVLNNLKYVEYINKVNVEINYENNNETFEANQIVDALFPNNNSLPSTIKWNS